MSKKFIARLCDQLGQVEANMADLKKQAEAIKEKLRAEGVGAYEGETFRCVVFESISYKLDMDAVRAKLSPQFISANSYKVAVVKVACKARSNENLKVAA